MTSLAASVSLQFSPEQQMAVATIQACEAGGVQKAAIVLAGAPSAGETLVLAHLAREWLKAGKPVELLAPTGRAAARYSSALGLPVRTIEAHLTSSPRVAPHCLLVLSADMAGEALHRLALRLKDDGAQAPFLVMAASELYPVVRYPWQTGFQITQLQKSFRQQSLTSQRSEVNMLQTAAQSVGLEGHVAEDEEGLYFAVLYRQGKPLSRPIPWRPHTNNGDAFCLAVKAGLSFEVTSSEAIVWPIDYPGDADRRVEVPVEGGDELAATRRAIVLAAVGQVERKEAMGTAANYVV